MISFPFEATAMSPAETTILRSSECTSIVQLVSLRNFWILSPFFPMINESIHSSNSLNCQTNINFSTSSSLALRMDNASSVFSLLVQNIKIVFKSLSATSIDVDAATTSLMNDDFPIMGNAAAGTSNLFIDSPNTKFMKVNISFFAAETASLVPDITITSNVSSR